MRGRLSLITDISGCAMNRDCVGTCQPEPAIIPVKSGQTDMVRGSFIEPWSSPSGPLSFYTCT